MFTNIICTTDGSEHADRALEYAAESRDTGQHPPRTALRPRPPLTAAS